MRDLTKVIKWLSTREAKFIAYKEVYKAREKPPKKGSLNNAIKN